MAPPMSTMPFGDHLEELRRRLILALLGIVPIFITCLFFGGPLLRFLVAPLTDALRAADQPVRLIATSPIETFAAYLKVSTALAIVIATPWILLQAWLFIAPGLFKRERRFVYFLIPMSVALTGLGLSFLYKVLLPISLTFLIMFGSGLVDQQPGAAALPEGLVLPTVPVLEGDPTAEALTGGAVPPGSVWINERLGEMRVHAGDGAVLGVRLDSGGAIAQEYRVGEYTSLLFTLGLVMAVAFQLPMVMMLLSWVGLLRPGDVTPYRRYVAFGCAAAGAILTPQDPWSMVLLGVALYVLFEAGIVLMRFVPARAVAGTDGREGDP